MGSSEHSFWAVTTVPRAPQAKKELAPVGLCKDPALPIAGYNRLCDTEAH